MFLILFTLLLTTALYIVLLWLAARRVIVHMQGNTAAVKALMEHLVVPLLGKRVEQPPAVTPCEDFRPGPKLKECAEDWHVELDPPKEAS